MENLTKEKQQDLMKLIENNPELEELVVEKLYNFSQDFLEDTFRIVQEHIETFSINGFKETTAFHALSGFVCQADSVASKELDSKHTITKQQSGEVLISFSEEPILRKVIDWTIDKIYGKQLLTIDAERYPDLLLTRKVCKDMCTSAFDEFFEDRKEMIIKEQTKSPKEEKVEIKSVEENFAF